MQGAVPDIPPIDDSATLPDKPPEELSPLKHGQLLLKVVAVQVLILAVLALLGKYVIPRLWPDFPMEFDFVAMTKTLFGGLFKYPGLLCAAVVVASVAVLLAGKRRW